MKNNHTSYSLPLYLIILSICVCSLSRLSQINAKIREMHARRTCQSLCQRYGVARLENKIPEKIMNMNVKLSLKDCSAVSNIIKLSLS